MKQLKLALRQIKYENTAFWRNPPAAFFTFIFPLIFLVLFNAIFGDDEIPIESGAVSGSNFYIPSILALSVISASYTNLAMTLTDSRDSGILKKIRGTPLSPWAFMVGKILFTTFVSLLLVVIVLICGVLFYNVSLPNDSLIVFITALLIGTITFSCLGIAITTVIRNADAAPAIVNASILPLFFISDIFIPQTLAPQWIKTLADIFPVKPFVVTLQSSFNPFDTRVVFETQDLATMGIWFLVGLIISLRYFSWEPRR